MADQYRTYANNFAFNGAGQLTGLSLGNVATESYGYDANRMQLTSQTATATGGTSNGLMNVTYGYAATSGQSGTGSSAGNSGQLMSISGTINGTPESAAYTYEDLGRLVTSNQTSNGSSAQRRFAYDRWGNRTGMWDATSGGTQIQSIALQQTSGVPTNQIASVTASAVTKNYTYDANGNLTNDGVHVYTYDGENRVKTVDWGTANQAAYAYDYANRRVKKFTNTATTYYAWEGNQVIGEYDSTGATVYNYVYSGSRLIARMGSGLINWYLSDRLSERLVLDGSGNVTGRMAHLPFGEDFGESGTQEKHHFTSYERDGESGTDYGVNRQYSQGTGRFMRVDPKTGPQTKPQSFNRYAYSWGDAVNLADPLGLNVQVCFIWTVWGHYGPSDDPTSLSETTVYCFSDWSGGGQGDDGDDGSGGGGGGAQAQRHIHPARAAEVFFHDQQDCEQAINKALEEKFSGVKGDFQYILSNTDFQDYRAHAYETLDKLKLDPIDLPPGTEWAPYTTTLDQVLGPGGVAAALTSLQTHTVYIGEGYFASSDFSQRGLVIVHETLHVAFGNHVAVANALHVKNDQGKDFQAGEEGAAFSAINTWMANDCHQ